MEIKTFQVGFARSGITPPFSVPMWGMGNDVGRMPNVFREELKADALAFSDGENTAVLFATDLLWIPQAFSDEVNRRCAASLGIPEGNAILTASHTHFAPTLEGDHPATAEYLRFLTPIIVETAKRALCDLAPAKMFIGRRNAFHLNSCRRYFFKDGTFGGVGIGKDAEPLAHENPGDPELSVIRFEREGKKAVTLANFSGHFPGDPDLHVMTSGVIHYFREEFEKEGDSTLTFFQGAAGDMGMSSRFPFENRAKGIQGIGRELAGEARRVLKELVPAQPGSVSVRRAAVQAELDHRDDEKLPLVKELLKRYSGNGFLSEEDRKASGLDTIVRLRAVLRQATRFAGMASLPVPLTVLSLGEVAFAGASYEMFSQSGRFVKNEAPQKMVFICENCNGTNGYIPTRESFPNGGFGADNSYFVPGTGEILAEKLAELLRADEKTENFSK